MARLGGQTSEFPQYPVLDPGQPGASPAVAPVKVAFLGAGSFARFLAANLAELSERVSAVFDPALESMPEAFGPARRAGSVEELLSDQAAEIVVIATPPSSHEELALAALAAGKHLFTEKPLALTEAGAQRILAAAERAGRLVQVDHVLLFTPIYRALQRLQQGFPEASAGPLLGTLRRYAFENDASNEHLEPGHWFWDRRVSGGIAVEHSVHFFAGAQLLRPDQPVAVSALTTGLGYPGVTDTFLINATYADGATASYAHAFTHRDRAEQQLTRLDFGDAKALIEGWIPVRATLDIWTDTLGASRWHELPGRAADLLAVPGFRLPGNAAITVADRAHGYPLEGRSHDGVRELSRRLAVGIDLGGEEAKGYLYSQGVIAAFADLLDAVAAGRPPRSGPRAASATLQLAEAAQLSADQRRTVVLG
ncbi:MAG: Gfo/Idh/MocA family protein [Candidatus Nanopelagicales bacterium]